MGLPMDKGPPVLQPGKLRLEEVRPSVAPGFSLSPEPSSLCLFVHFSHFYLSHTTVTFSETQQLIHSCFRVSVFCLSFCYGNSQAYPKVIRLV